MSWLIQRGVYRSNAIGGDPAAVAAAGLATTPGYNFTIDNALLASLQNGLNFPASAVTTPSTATTGWFAGFMFKIPENFLFLANTETLAQKGTAAIAGGGNDAAIYIVQANGAINVTSTGALTLRAIMKSAGANWFNSGIVGPIQLARNTAYSLILGQIGSNYFFTITDTAGNIITNTNGAVGFAANSYSLWTGLGCAAGMASGNALGFSGAMANTFMAWGNFPGGGTASTISTATLQQIAQGVTDIKTVVSGVSGTYRYFNAMDPTSSLTSVPADATASITGAMTQITTWTPAIPGLIGEPVRTQTYLTLTPEGDGGYYVWGVVPGQSTGSVWFRGTYAIASGGAPTFEAKLVRKDNGATLVDWTALSSPVVAGGAFSGCLTGVTAGVGFTRMVRFTGQAATAYTSSEKHGVGVVIVGNAQSQMSMMTNVATNGAGGSTGTVTPTDTSNVFGCVMRMPNGIADTVPGAPNQSFGPINDVISVKPCLPTSIGAGLSTTGIVADPILAMIGKVQAQSSLPVMFVDLSHSGSAPWNWYMDRQTVTLTGAAGNGWSPNGATTTFTIAPTQPTTATISFLAGKSNPLGGNYGDLTPITNSVGTSNPMIKPGTLSIVAGGITITDDGNGNLSGTGVTGTINYYGSPGVAPTYRLVFNVAPVNGATLTSTWTFLSDYTATSNGPKATTIQIGANPTAGQTLTINGTVITFVASGATGNQVNIGAAASNTASNLLTFLQGSADAQLVKYTYSLSSVTITLTPANAYTNVPLVASSTNPSVLFVLGANGYTNLGVIGTPHTGHFADAYIRLWNNQVTAVIYPWWTTLAPVCLYSGQGSGSTYAAIKTALYQHLDAIKWMHKQQSNVASAKYFFAPAARECPGSGSSELASTYGAHRYGTYAYVRDNPSDCALLADMNDATIWNGTIQTGPHEDWYGYQAMGQRYGTSIAAALGYGGANLYSGTDNAANGIPNAPVMGPVLTGVTRKNSTTLTLTFALPNGTSLSSYGGVTTVGTTIVGFEVGTSNTSAALAYTGRAIASGTIQSATTIDVTTPTQLTFVSLSYCAGYNVFTGTANYTADTANLKNLLCDNAGGYTLPTAGNGAGPAAGNGAQSVLDWAA
jgi:hypothetical protein